MIPAPFDYYRAGSVEEAIALLQEHEDAKLLAGGHSLIPMLKLRLSLVPALIDISRIPELKTITSESGRLRIGALASYAALEGYSELPPALSDAVRVIGDPAVRNLGTVGGSLAHADPAADLPPVLLALEATLRVQGPEGERTLSAADFFTGIFETALREHDLITAVELPLPQQASAYVKLADPASRYALVGCAAALTMEGGECRGARVALGGMLPFARRLPAAEAALVGTPADAEAVRRATEAVNEDISVDDVMGDLSGSAEYRLAMAAQFVGRALHKAAARAQEDS